MATMDEGSNHGPVDDAGGPLGEDLQHVLSFRAMEGWFDAHLTPQNSDMFTSNQSLDRTAHPPCGKCKFEASMMLQTANKIPFKKKSRRFHRVPLIPNVYPWWGIFLAIDA